MATEELPILVIGGGPAGLTAAYQLTKAKRDVIVCEADPVYVGGISRTVEYNGYRFDIGGHRFFSKSKEIEALWDEILDEDMLIRDRSSRIFYRKKFFTYPLKPIEAFIGLGPLESICCVFSYIKAKCLPCREPKNFEQWVSNKFGKRLYSIFFKTYTEKVWGMPCTEISADWAAQRIKGLSLSTALVSAIKKPSNKGEVVKTLINTFRYPRKGPGMLWEQCAEKIIKQGGEVKMGSKVVELERDGDHWLATIGDASGAKQQIKCDSVISSAPLSKLVTMLEPEVSAAVLESANSLSYRDFITVAVIVSDDSDYKDQWIYIHDPDVKVGRVQNYKAWSPEMVPNENTACFGLEYFCFEHDGLWAMSDTELKQLAKDEIVQLGLVNRDNILDSTVVRQKKAYPVYDDDYADHVANVRQELEANYPTIYPVGRNGMHQYNNQDHSMMTALLCVENILSGKNNFDIWAVNEDAAYTESGTDSSVSGLRLVPMPTQESNISKKNDRLESLSEKGDKFCDYIEDQIRHDSWKKFHDDLFDLPETARRLYLTSCFHTGVVGDGFPGAFDFYAYEGRSLIDEIIAGYQLVGLDEVSLLIDQAFTYWENKDSPMHSDEVPWSRMDKDLNDVHGKFFAQTKTLLEAIGSIIEKVGAKRILEG